MIRIDQSKTITTTTKAMQDKPVENDFETSSQQSEKAQKQQQKKWKSKHVAAKNASSPVISSYFQKNPPHETTAAAVDKCEIKEEPKDSPVIDLTQTTPEINTSTQMNLRDRKPFLNIPFVSPIREKTAKVQERTRSAPTKRKKENVEPTKTPLVNTAKSSLKSFEFSRSNKFKKEPFEIVDETITVVSDTDDEDFEADFKKPKGLTGLYPVNAKNSVDLNCVHCGEHVCSLLMSTPNIVYLDTDSLTELPDKMSIAESKRVLAVLDEDNINLVEQSTCLQKSDDLLLNSYLDQAGRCWQYYECKSCFKVVAVILRCMITLDNKFSQNFHNKFLLLSD